MEKLGRDEGWKEEYKVALKAYMRIAAEERAWAYHLSTDRAEADYRNGLILAKERGREEGRVTDLRNLMDSFSLTVTQAMDTLKIPENERDKFAALLSS